MEDRRDLDPAPPARRPATAAAAPPEAGLSGPGTPRDPVRGDTESPPTRAAAAGHPGHDPALAPRHRPPPLGCKVDPRQERQARLPPEHQGPGPPAAPRKPRLGLPQDPRRAGRAGSASRGVDGIGDPEGGRIDPAPRRTGPTWSLFLRSQAEAILACDFFTADLLDGTQAYVLTVIEHASRRIRILGVTSHPTGEWTVQQARNLIMDLGEHAYRVKFMIRDRGSNFTAAFDAVLAGAGIRTVLCNVRTPRMNAIAERWIGGCRARLLDRTLVWNQAHLRRILHEYEIHHNQHRPHRSLAAAPLKPLPEPVDLDRYRVRRQADQRVPPGRMTWTRFSARTPFWSRSKMNGKSASAATCPKDPWPSSSSHPQARRG